MNRNPFLLVIILFLNFVINSDFVETKQFNNFLNLLSNKIYNDCKNKDLIIKEDLLLDLRNGVFLTSLDEEATKWPNYDKQLIYEILSIFSSREPFGKFIVVNDKKEYVGITPQFTFSSLSQDIERTILNTGDNLLRCGGNVLDINETDYYWNNEKFTIPTNTFIAVDTLSQNNFTLFGFNLISKGGLTLVGFSLLSLFGVSIIFNIAIVFKKLYQKIYKRDTKINIFRKKNKC